MDGFPINYSCKAGLNLVADLVLDEDNVQVSAFGGRSTWWGVGLADMLAILTRCMQSACSLAGEKHQCFYNGESQETRRKWGCACLLTGKKHRRSCNGESQETGRKWGWWLVVGNKSWDLDRGGRMFTGVPNELGHGDLGWGEMQLNGGPSPGQDCHSPC